jgi:2-haloacid dehalogenase
VTAPADAGATSPQRWATFDCYGTLVDWQRGMRDALVSVAGSSADELLRGYHEVEAVVQVERFRLCRSVMVEALRRAPQDRHLPLRPGAEHVLARALRGWPVFADVGPSLARLRELGWRLAILSNIDRDLLAGTLERLPVAFDVVVTAQDVGRYKPGLEHFRHFAQLSGVGRGSWVHVACSLFHDVAPAGRLGIPAVWIAREGAGEAARVAPAQPVPAAVLPGLEALPRTLAGLVTQCNESPTGS